MASLAVHRGATEAGMQPGNPTGTLNETDFELFGHSTLEADDILSFTGEEANPQGMPAPCLTSMQQQQQPPQPQTQQRQQQQQPQQPQFQLQSHHQFGGQDVPPTTIQPHPQLQQQRPMPPSMMMQQQQSFRSVDESCTSASQRKRRSSGMPRQDKAPKHRGSGGGNSELSHDGSAIDAPPSFVSVTSSSTGQPYPPRSTSASDAITERAGVVTPLTTLPDGSARLIPDWFAVLGDKQSGGRGRTTTATALLRDVKEWYKEQKPLYRDQGRVHELLDDALERYFGLVASAFENFPTDPQARKETILIYCSKEALQSDRAASSNCFTYEPDKPAKFGLATVPAAISFFLDSRDAPSLPSVVRKLRREFDALRSSPDAPPVEMQTHFEGLLQFCEMQLAAALSQEMAQKLLDKLNLIPALREQWKFLKEHVDAKRGGASPGNKRSSSRSLTSGISGKSGGTMDEDDPDDDTTMGGRSMSSYRGGASTTSRATNRSTATSRQPQSQPYPYSSNKSASTTSTNTTTQTNTTRKQNKISPSPQETLFGPTNQSSNTGLPGQGSKNLAFVGAAATNSTQPIFNQGQFTTMQNQHDDVSECESNSVWSSSYWSGHPSVVSAASTTPSRSPPSNPYGQAPLQSLSRGTPNHPMNNHNGNNLHGYAAAGMGGRALDEESLTDYEGWQQGQNYHNYHNPSGEFRSTEINVMRSFHDSASAISAVSSVTAATAMMRMGDGTMEDDERSNASSYYYQGNNYGGTPSHEAFDRMNLNHSDNTGVMGDTSGGHFSMGIRGDSVASASSRGPLRARQNRRRSIRRGGRRGSCRGNQVAGNCNGRPDGPPPPNVYYVTTISVVDPHGDHGLYTGSISNESGMPHGFGRFEFLKGGRWYEGNWIHGHWTGQGKLSNGDGSTYEGGFQDDLKHGQGIMTWNDGRVFDGLYKHGQMSWGKMTFADGGCYFGYFENGVQHGKGNMVFADNSKYEGEFENGNFHGQGKMTWNDGGYYEGAWENGMIHGYGKEIRANGSLRHEGMWSNGAPVR